ncbi:MULTISPECIES: hypothetical protein [Streptococcus]|uniref:hypothetical protein n=1 Tax=Streptococcus TaxID=1301 RepID=UPI0023547DC3|nr:hypothetical protein [Streptococcus orisratti]MCI7678088.1 hypothetical protein [Streptococcus orisratti]MDY4002863.1 hypothetical protein [Streptococcus orisratti]MDY5635290.1 hypothetical protein [Streptococcus orisratti]
MLKIIVIILAIFSLIKIIAIIFVSRKLAPQEMTAAEKKAFDEEAEKSFLDDEDDNDF